MRKIIFLAGTAAILALYQNCSAGMGFGTIESVDLASTSVEFTSAKMVMQNNCMSCHSTTGPGSRFDFATEREFIASGLIVPGQPDQSKLIQRMANYIGAQSGAARNMPPSGPISDADYKAIRRWIVGASSNDAPFACETNGSVESRIPISPTHVLTNRQYLNSVKQLLSVFAPAEAVSLYQTAMTGVVLNDNTEARYERAVSDITPERLTSFFKVADKVAELLSNSSRVDNVARTIIDLERGICNFSNMAGINDDCRKQLIRNLGLRIYRRPLQEGVTNEVTMFNLEFTGVSPSVGFGNVIFRMLMSQNFLLQMEDQEIDTQVQNVLKLSSYSAANRLSYAFWNSMPDEALFAQAKTGMTVDASFLAALDYVLAHDNIQDSMKEFAYQWLLLKKKPAFDSGSFGVSNFREGINFDTNMKTAMDNETGDLFSFVVKNDGPFSELFTTDVSVTSYAPLMQVYGVSSPGSPSMTRASAPRMPAGTRYGLLTRGALLAEGNGQQHLIHRAIRIKRDIMCVSTPPAPADTTPPVAMTEDQIRTYTTRQKFAHNTGSGVCFSCHQTINPFGFALSKYNGLGFYKQTEPAFGSNRVFTGAQLPLDSTTNMTGILSGAGAMQDAQQFSSFVANRAETKSCFSKNFAQFFLAQELDVNTMGCRLNKVYSNLKSSGTLKEALRSMAADSEFRYKKLGP